MKKCDHIWLRKHIINNNDVFVCSKCKQETVYKKGDRG